MLFLKLCGNISKSPRERQRNIRVWRSLVSRLNGVQEASSSNLDTRTMKTERAFALSVFIFSWEIRTIQCNCPMDSCLPTAGRRQHIDSDSWRESECSESRHSDQEKLTGFDQKSVNFSFFDKRFEPLNTTVRWTVVSDYRKIISYYQSITNGDRL